MDAPVPADVCLFEAFRLDRRAGVLFRRDEGGALVPVAIGSRALAVLDTPRGTRGRSGLEGRDHGRRLAGNGGRRKQFDGSDIGAPSGSRSRREREAAASRQSPGAATALAGAVSRAPPAATPSLPDKPSIAVLPFQNMSDDPEQEYFADGMVEEIITALVADPLALRHRPQFELHLQGPADRREAGRA